MEPVIDCATSDLMELVRIVWISLGLMIDPYSVMKIAGFVVAVFLCAILLLKCAVRVDPPREKYHHY